MKQKNIYKMISMVGLLLGGIGTLLSGWADNKNQDEMIKEKVEEILRKPTPQFEEIKEP